MSDGGQGASSNDGEATGEAEGGDESGPMKMVGAIAAVLLGLATVATAWGAYQANRWSGVMTTEFNEAIALNSDAGKEFQEGDAQYTLDSTVYVDWAIALTEDNTELAAYLQESLFSDELSAATEEWTAMGDDAPASPFELDSYYLPQWTAGDELEAETEAKFDTAKEANQRGDNYVLVTVVFASVLFFAGMASTVSRPAIKVGFLVIGGVLFVGAAGVMATFPVW